VQAGVKMLACDGVTMTAIGKKEKFHQLFLLAVMLTLIESATAQGM